MKTLLPCLALGLGLVSEVAAQTSEQNRIEIPGQIVICVSSASPSLDLEPTIQAWDLDSREPGLRVQSSRSLLSWQRRGEADTTSLILLDLRPAGLVTPALRQRLSVLPDVLWAAPNAGYTGQVKELVPNDPQFGSQYHHPLMQNIEAWDITLGDSSVIMGITDDGVDIDHEDLVGNIWTNPGEVPGDGIDNDGNGFIDDVQGFDFVFDNNDPNPNSGGDDHGTHVAGIAGAGTNNGIGIAGTAGAATIMPLQFYSSSQPWTAADIAESFAYGVDNGARILSTSYNINGWVGDPVVTAAFDYIYDQGALHFNSAGNGGELNPARQAFHQTFLVANTNSGDQKSSSSNYGTGVDLAAPGSSILSTILNDGYGQKSGTSMAAPNAAGVAALIWSANPGWTRDQVAAQLTYTADNIDAQNPGIEGLMGGGRVNAFRALTETLPAPQLTLANGLPAEGAALIGELGAFELRFDQILDPASINGTSAFRLDYAGGDDTFGTADDVQLPLAWDEYLIAGNAVTFAPPSALPFAGVYRVIADAGVLSNPFGTALDGNGDAIPGDSWSRTFSACATAVLFEDNAESGADWSVINESLQTGAWTVPPEVPIGGGLRNDPPTDFDGSGKCFLTENAPGDTDVDAGPTRLISRSLDLSVDADPYLSFAAWLGTNGTDVIEVDLSADDGATWIPIDSISGTDGWEVQNYRVLDFVAPTASMRLRFSVEDAGSPSITEAGIDTLRIFRVLCDDPTPVGTSYCVTSPNSVGSGGLIRAEGSDVVADNDFTLITEGLPVGEFSLYFFGPSQVQTPLGDGFLCVGGTLSRLVPAAMINGLGEARRTVDLTAFPASGVIVSGVSLNFQLWYRDSAAGGSGSNLSDGLNVLWQ